MYLQETLNRQRLMTNLAITAILAVIFGTAMTTTNSVWAAKISCPTEPNTNICNGTNDDDKIDGASHRDFMNGMSGDDKMYGNGGDDDLFGRDGDDKMYGNGGIDNMNGGRGTDKMYGGAGPDNVDGSNGNDKIYWRSRR